MDTGVTLNRSHVIYNQDKLFWSIAYGGQRTLCTNTGSFNCSGSQTVTPLNTWIHVAVTYDGQKVRHYLNGALDGSPSNYIIPPDVSNTEVGGNNWIYAGFDGRIDDMRVYDRALSSKEIRMLFDGACENPAGLSGDIIFNDDYKLLQYCNGVNWMAIGKTLQAPTAGMIHYWPMNETNDIYVDVIGGVSCAAQDGSKVWDTTGVRGQAAYFNGTSGAYTNCGNLSTTINSATKMTMTAWMKRNAASARVSISKQSSGTGFGLIYWDSSPYARATFLLSDGPSYEEGYVADNDTDWHHLAFVYDGTQGANATRLKGYIDGQPVALTFNGTIPATTGSSYNTGFRIGHAGNDVSNGVIDEVRIYGDSLTDAQILTLYNATK